MIIIAIYLLISCVLVFKPKNHVLLICSLIIFYSFYDYIDYLASQHDVSNSAKAFPETVILIAFVYKFLNRKISKSDIVFMLGLLVVTVTTVLVGVMNGKAVITEIGVLRGFISPILLLISLGSTLLIGRHQLMQIVRFFSFVCVLTVISAIYQYLSFEGDYAAVWKFQVLLDAKLASNENFLPHFMQYQIVRNDSLRASAQFYSALDFGYVTGFMFFATTISIVLVKSFRRNIFVLLMPPLFLIGSYVSNTRSSFLLPLFCGLITAYILKKRRKAASSVVLVITFISALVTLGFVSYSGDTIDASALGRLNQYLYLFDNFSMVGHGFSERYFDSFYIYGFYAFGVTFVVFLWCGVKLVASSIPFEIRVSNFYGLLLLVWGLGLLYVMSFQLLIGSFIYKIYFIALCCFSSYYNNSHGK